MGLTGRLIGMNHIALEVGDLDEALALYGRLFAFQLRGRHGSRMAFIDMGDQFVALAAGRRQPADDDRHVGFVVDAVEAVREAGAREGLRSTGHPGGGLDFWDPWGNRIQVVAYADIQFERTPGVKRKLGIEAVEKSPGALREISERGLDG